MGLVIEAKDLMQADRFSQSDPYTVVTFGNDWESTYTINNSNNPVWKKQQPFHFEVRSRTTKLFVDVFDKNKLEKDVFLGQVEISLKELEDGSNRDAWWPLHDRLTGVDDVSASAHKSDKPITGSIHLKIEYTWSRISELAAGFLNDDIDIYAVKGEAEVAEFSMSLLMANLTQFYALLEPVINWYYRQWDYWLWTDASASFTMLLVYSFVALNNWLLPTLIPLYLLGYMSWNYIEVGGKLTSADDDDYTFAIQEGEQQVDMGFLGISYYKSQMQLIQNSIGDTNVFIQGQKDLFNWRYPSTTKFVWIGVAVLTVLWTIVPFRFVMFTITLYLFTRYTRFYTWTWRIYKGIYKIVQARYGRNAQVKRRGFEASKKSVNKPKKVVRGSKPDGQRVVKKARKAAKAAKQVANETAAAARAASQPEPATPPSRRRKHKRHHRSKGKSKAS